jgi:ABC-type cobalamin transport system permease subunit
MTKLIGVLGNALAKQKLAFVAMLIFSPSNDMYFTVASGDWVQKWSLCQFTPVVIFLLCHRYVITFCVYDEWDPKKSSTPYI